MKSRNDLPAPAVGIVNVQLPEVGSVHVWTLPFVRAMVVVLEAVSVPILLTLSV